MNSLSRIFRPVLMLILGLSGLYPGFLQSANAQETRVSLAGGASDSPRFLSRNEGTTRHLEISSLRQATPPFFVQSRLPDDVRAESILVFTYSDQNLARGPGFNSTLRGKDDPRVFGSRRVEVVFAHENWQVLHPMTVVTNQFLDLPDVRIFFLYYTLPRETRLRLEEAKQDIEYRLVVDGIWMADPVNPQNRTRKNGITVSWTSLEEAGDIPELSPEILPQEGGQSAENDWRSAPDTEQMRRLALKEKNPLRTVVLRWIGKPDQEVYVQGTFNNFEPYVTPLRATRWYQDGSSGNAVYETTLRLLPGQYWYLFYINGQLVPDALNHSLGSGPGGARYSILSVP